ncbi:sporulation membrane protein YtaF [Thalassobacillus devorans]|uniref:sporulation membrane protein YtaF n=1 Tax=Thalassobacillus devorans TaxID=279813 RepID=UPI000A1CE50E|nr:sporulation membrane protein YtaF [Thalassobacillus devorans]
MGVYVTLILLVMAVSLDSLGLGVVYGLKKIRLSFLPMMMIAGLSALIFYVAITAGNMLNDFLPEHAGENLGAFILIGLGAWFLLQLIMPSKESGEEKEPSTWSSPSDILKDPELADMDNSGSIKGWEAVLLAMALSLDTLGAGISAAFMKLPSLITALSIGFMTSFLLYTGLKLGHRFSKCEWVDKAVVVPGIMLILLGIFKLV